MKRGGGGRGEKGVRGNKRRKGGEVEGMRGEMEGTRRERHEEEDRRKGGGVGERKGIFFTRYIIIEAIARPQSQATWCPT